MQVYIYICVCVCERERERGRESGSKWQKQIVIVIVVIVIVRCLCASRWYEAMQAGCAPPVILKATNIRALDSVPLEDLKKYAIDDVDTNTNS